MKKIKIFLASSNELVEERRQFEIEIYRKTKLWFDNGLFLHLDVWEDLSARMSNNGSQSEYNKLIKSSDIFVLLANSKVGMYTAEEFETAFGKFKETKKPFIYTYFKNREDRADKSLNTFKAHLETLKHYYSKYDDFNDLWNQFNKELERLEDNAFKKHVINTRQISEKNIVEQDIKNVKRIKIGDNNSQTNEPYSRKNIVKGSVEGADEFILGDRN